MALEYCNIESRTPPNAARLNEMWSGGWEFIQTIALRDGYMSYFKREKPND